MEHVSPIGPFSTPQFVAKLSSSIVYSQHIPERGQLGLQQIVGILSRVPRLTFYRSWDRSWRDDRYSTSSTSNATGTSVSASSTPNTATPIPIVRLGGRGSNAGLITGSIVGGIAAMSLLVAALFFYQRLCRSQASSAAQPAVESAGDSLSGYFAYNTPMLSQIPSRTSSRRNPYAVSPLPSPEFHAQCVLPTV